MKRIPINPGDVFAGTKIIEVNANKADHYEYEQHRVECLRCGDVYLRAHKPMMQSHRTGKHFGCFSCSAKLRKIPTKKVLT
jgi:hypothetical protein